MIRENKDPSVPAVRAFRSIKIGWGSRQRQREDARAIFLSPFPFFAYLITRPRTRTHGHGNPKSEYIHLGSLIGWSSSSKSTSSSISYPIHIPKHQHQPTIPKTDSPQTEPNNARPYSSQNRPRPRCRIRRKPSGRDLVQIVALELEDRSDRSEHSFLS